LEEEDKEKLLVEILFLLIKQMEILVVVEVQEHVLL
jgi:hypothetical protein